MLFRKLTLTNYGLFAGRQEFDLVPRERHGRVNPIVLFGGKNGAGKTTILESIRLALYGRLSLGSRVRQVDYTGFLRSRVWRGVPSVVRPVEASIAIEFDHIHRGDIDSYVIERAWRLAGKEGVDETLTIAKNGRPLDDVDSEFWPSFVRDVIPEGLAQLFFFDGEKIQELAEDASGSGALADSIKSLLGLDLVERLDADLTVYATRQVAKLGSTDDKEKARQLARDILQLEKSITGVNEELASLRTRADGVNAETRRAEEHLRQEGEDLARRRERLVAEKTSLGAKLETAERLLRDHCDHLLPLALCPKTAKALMKQLKAERLSAQAGDVRDALNAVRRNLLQVVKTMRAGKNALGPSGVAAVSAAIESVFDAHMPDQETQTTHGLSDGESRKVLSSLSAARSEAAPAAINLGRDMRRWGTRLEVIERHLAQIPADEVLAPRVEALALLQKRLGAIEQSSADASERLKRFEIDIEQKRREQRRLSESQGAAGEASARVSLARTVQSALGDYLAALTELKVTQLRDSVADCFNRLSRKGDIVQRVEIDPRSFVVTLFDQGGQAVPKEELSSGEKQIFAIAMLWGLAKTSGRPLPIIIDTPLGRLDSDHRRKLIHDYLPHASHQVIVLSTDTEVDQVLFEELRPAISHAYHLSFHPEERCTEASKGYFWRVPQELACTS